MAKGIVPKRPTAFRERFDMAAVVGKAIEGLPAEKQVEVLLAAGGKMKPSDDECVVYVQRRFPTYSPC